jgi:serine phosphatase RsbU (regulator of sigma subunit)
LTERPEIAALPSATGSEIIPAAFAGLQFSARCSVPAGGIAEPGDQYDVLPLGRRCGIAVVGARAARRQAVTGSPPAENGVTAARATLLAVAGSEPNPSKVLAAVNEALIALPGAERKLITAVYATFRPAVNGVQVRISGAGQQTNYVREAGGRVLPLTHLTTLLGLGAHPHLREDRLLLRPGDSLVMVCGSVTGADHVSAGSGQVSQIVSDLGSASAVKSADTIIRAVTELRGGRLDPNVIVLVLKLPGNYKASAAHAAPWPGTRRGEADDGADEPADKSGLRLPRIIRRTRPGLAD